MTYGDTGWGSSEQTRALETIGCVAGRREGWDYLPYASDLTSLLADCSDFPHGGI